MASEVQKKMSNELEKFKSLQTGELLYTSSSNILSIWSHSKGKNLWVFQDSNPEILRDTHSMKPETSISFSKKLAVV